MQACRRLDNGFKEFDFDIDSTECLDCGEDNDTLLLYTECRRIRMGVSREEYYEDSEEDSEEDNEEDESKERIIDTTEGFQELEDRDKDRDKELRDE